MEDEAARALSRLDKLQARQLQLAARNALLEAVADSNFDFESKEVGPLFCNTSAECIDVTAVHTQRVGYLTQLQQVLSANICAIPDLVTHVHCRKPDLLAALHVCSIKCFTANASASVWPGLAAESLHASND